MKQQISLHKISNFIENTSFKCKLFSLVGPPGSGKTTIIKTLFSDEKYMKKHIALSATTNKAVSVIENMFLESNLNLKNIDFLTIHKLCQIKRILILMVTNTLIQMKIKCMKSKKSIYSMILLVMNLQTVNERW